MEKPNLEIEIPEWIRKIEELIKAEKTKNNDENAIKNNDKPNTVI